MSEETMTANSGDGLWTRALTAARGGAVETARELCAEAARGPEPFPMAHDLLLGRCLAEAGADLTESIALLDRVIEGNPRNVLAPHVLALACLRSGDDARAAELLRRHGLPHDHALLAHSALAIETVMREWPPSPPEDWPPWPPQLDEASEDPAGGEAGAEAEPDESEPERAEGAPENEKVEGAGASDAPSPPPAGIKPPRLTLAQRWRFHRLQGPFDRWIKEHDLTAIARETNRLMAEGIDTAELQVVAGLACEEGGDPTRARAHLTRALAMDENMLIGRTFLGRVYWRLGWFDLAEGLWRSLPVEGPDDYGRHYHLGLAHEALGRRAGALEAMNVALADFFIETRELYIQRVFDRWLRRFGAAAGGEKLA